MQKLITIYFTDSENKHPIHPKYLGLHEHLGTYLDNGWTVVSMSPVGSSSGGTHCHTNGWLAVLLEKR